MQYRVRDTNPLNKHIWEKNRNGGLCFSSTLKLVVVAARNLRFPRRIEKSENFLRKYPGLLTLPICLLYTFHPNEGNTD